MSSLKMKAVEHQPSDAEIYNGRVTIRLCQLNENITAFNNRLMELKDLLNPVLLGTDGIQPEADEGDMPKTKAASPLADAIESVIDEVSAGRRLLESIFSRLDL